MSASKIEVRGPIWDLWQRLRFYDGPPVVWECLAEGAAGTSKSRTIGHMLCWAGFAIPGLRILVCRKTRASLTESFLQTWEDEVLPAHNAEQMREGATRGHRENYDFGNGSIMVMGGLDHPTRLYSTQWDIVYVQEAIELTLDEWERFFRSLRHFGGGGLKWQLLLGDTNPDAKTHWLNERCEEGVCERLRTTFKHNPKYWSKDNGDWTDEGRAYIAGLEKLSGVRRARLLEGKWVTAEGAVWDTYDPDVHLIDRPQDLKRDLGINRFVGAVDWGFADPGCLLVFGLDADDRAYLVAEWYTTKRDQSWWAEQVAIACAEFTPMKAIVCDPADSQGGRAAINLRLAKNGHKPVAIPADNARHSQAQGDLVGLDLVRERFRVDPVTGKAGIYLLRDSGRVRDEELERSRLPTGLHREIPGYVFLVDESGKPSKERTDPSCPDHACDPTRYLANFIWRHSMQNPEPALKPRIGSLAAQLAVRNPEAAREWLEQEAWNKRKEKVRG